jgi:hypothetical protein
MSILGHAPSFFGQISHDMIIVAFSLSFLNVLKLCCFVLFSWRQLQKCKKERKKPDDEKNLLPHLSTREAL